MTTRTPIFDLATATDAQIDDRYEAVRSVIGAERTALKNELGWRAFRHWMQHNTPLERKGIGYVLDAVDELVRIPAGRRSNLRKRDLRVEAENHC